MQKSFSKKHNLPTSFIEPGEYYATNHPEIIGTLVGSCITVCLFDQENGVGGMNHFMLPRILRPEEILTTDIGRYGLFAMELLVGEIIKKGGDRKTLKGKCFGGGNVLRFRQGDGNIPESNIRFIRKYFELEGIPLVNEDLGGPYGRKIYFFTPESRVLLKRLSPDGREDLFKPEEVYKVTLLRKRMDNQPMTLF
jgi:chemotaxis protein CheD